MQTHPLPPMDTHMPYYKILYRSCGFFFLSSTCCYVPDILFLFFIIVFLTNLVYNDDIEVIIHYYSTGTGNDPQWTSFFFFFSEPTNGLLHNNTFACPWLRTLFITILKATGDEQAHHTTPHRRSHRKATGECLTSDSLHHIECVLSASVPTHYRNWSWLPPATHYAAESSEDMKQENWMGCSKMRWF